MTKWLPSVNTCEENFPNNYKERQGQGLNAYGKQQSLVSKETTAKEKIQSTRGTRVGILWRAQMMTCPWEEEKLNGLRILNVTLIQFKSKLDNQIASIKTKKQAIKERKEIPYQTNIQNYVNK